MNRFASFAPLCAPSPGMAAWPTRADVIPLDVSSKTSVHFADGGALDTIYAGGQ